MRADGVNKLGGFCWGFMYIKYHLAACVDYFHSNLYSLKTIYECPEGSISLFY